MLISIFNLYKPLTTIIFKIHQFATNIYIGAGRLLWIPHWSEWMWQDRRQAERQPARPILQAPSGRLLNDSDGAWQAQPQQVALLWLPWESKAWLPSVWAVSGRVALFWWCDFLCRRWHRARAWRRCTGPLLSVVVLTVEMVYCKDSLRKILGLFNLEGGQRLWCSSYAFFRQLPAAPTRHLLHNTGLVMRDGPLCCSHCAQKLHPHPAVLSPAPQTVALVHFAKAVQTAPSPLRCSPLRLRSLTGTAWIFHFPGPQGKSVAQTLSNTH